MKVLANISFNGIISMTIGEEREIEQGEVLIDLLNAGYVTEIKPVSNKKGVKADESK